MARNIDADKLRQALVNRQITTQFFNLRERHEIGCIIEMLDNAPTADVVPRSEVERLQAEIERLKKAKYIFSTVDYCSDDLAAALEENKKLTIELKANRMAANSYKMHYEQLKTEVAREIFAEIEFDIHQLMFERDETRAIAIEGVIAELKKKYAEVEG